MNVGERLRGLRLAKHFSQGDLEKRTGLLRCYLSRVECGHTVPSVETLEKIANALDLEFYQLFYSGQGKPSAPKIQLPERLMADERNLLEIFRGLSHKDKKLLLQLSRLSGEERYLASIFRRLSAPDRKLLMELAHFSADKLRDKT